MPNYNTQLQSNNTDLQAVLQSLRNKAAGGEQATPEISVDRFGLITATAGAKTSTYQLAFQSAKTVLPGKNSQIAVSGGHFTGGNIMVAGDSNLKAENIKSGVSIFGVSGTLESGSIGSEEQEDTFITKAIGGSYFNDRVTTIGGGVFAGCKNLTAVNFPACITIDCASVPGNFPPIGAFQYCTELTTANFPACTSIGSNAFCKCGNLTTVSFPVCTSIGNSAFYYCEDLTTANFPACTYVDDDAFCDCAGLTTVSFPVCTYIDRRAFGSCKNLTTVNFPACTNIGSSAFASCKSLTTASFPACTSIDMNAFSSCERLTTVSFPVCTYVGYSAFASCKSLTTASFPACTSIGSGAFYSCISLITANFPACTNIGSSAFYRCYNLKSLYLTGSSLCKLSNSNAFTSTPIGGYSASAKTYGSIYVPASLLTSYQTATNWTYFSSRFVAFYDAGDGGSDD